MAISRYFQIDLPHVSGRDREEKYHTEVIAEGEGDHISIGWTVWEGHHGAEPSGIRSQSLARAHGRVLPTAAHSRLHSGVETGDIGNAEATISKCVKAAVLRIRNCVILTLRNQTALWYAVPRLGCFSPRTRPKTDENRETGRSETGI